MIRTLSTAAIVAAMLHGPVSAQDVNADPTYETVTLNGNFSPDPYTVSITSGGMTDASILGGSCRGFIATSPDVRLNFNPGSLPLILSAASDADTTIVVNAPDGNWYCDDDSGGSLNPMLQFDPAMGGRYEIWIGTYGEEGYHPATVNISELYGPNGDMVATTAPPPTNMGGPDINADPVFETVRLSAGFTPDPYNIDLWSGGANDASNISMDCIGYIGEAPDVRLNYTAGSFPLILSAISNQDTTLVVNAPDGNWYCNDDSPAGFDPLIEFASPRSGRYEIWVGTYGSSDNHNAQLQISEIYEEYAFAPPPPTPAPRPSGYPAGGVEVNAPSTYGEVGLTSGFAPDPHVVRIMSGGPEDASSVSSGCSGFVATAPDVRLNFDAGGLPLFISTSSMADTTLLINAPDGRWYCDDDSGQGFNPSVRFQTPLSGRYEIWVGTYGAAENHSAEVNISELYSQ